MQIYKLLAFISYLIGLVVIFVNIVYPITDIYRFATIALSPSAGIFVGEYIVNLKQTLKELK